jgi:ABC-type dipeptide/oligopeptide/nickel transport system permease subunit
MVNNVKTSTLFAALTRKKYVKPSLALDILKGTFHSPGSKFGAIILILVVFICLLAPLVSSYGMNQIDLNSMYEKPSIKHIFGTDNMGRDLLTRILYGGRYSLALGCAASAFSTLVAIVIGLIAGYVGGKVEYTILRIMDIFSSLPAILLSIMIATVLGPGFFNTIIALSIAQIPYSVRMIRAQILSERSKEYLEAAVSIDCSKLSIMFRHLLPNVISPMIVCFTMGIGDNITTAAGLSFIGLGIQPPMPEWGALLSDARTHMLSYPYLIIFPGIFIMLTVLSANLLGDGLRDAIDPKLRK